MSSLRVVSLVPAGTEILAGLGLTEALVGRSHECDYPPLAAQSPICTRTLVDPTLPAAEIDLAVKEQLAAGRSLFEIDVDQLTQLQPTHLITQQQCVVCAVSDDQVRDALDAARCSQTVTVSIGGTTLDATWNDIQLVSDCLNHSATGTALVEQLKQRLDDVRKKSSELSRRPTVLCLEWTDPLMSAGNWVPELIEAAGGDVVLATAGERSDWISMADIVAADPDIIICMPCGFDLDRSTSEAERLLSHPDWRTLRAVQNNALFATDSTRMFTRPGPGLIESAELLQEILFDALNEGSSCRSHTDEINGLGCTLYRKILV